MITPTIVESTAPPRFSEQPDHDHDHEDGEHAHRQLDHTSTPRSQVSITALTGRGTAAVHLSRFQDAWAELTAEDRQWFAHWLTGLLVDACLEAPAPTA